MPTQISDLQEFLAPPGGQMYGGELFYNLPFQVKSAPCFMKIRFGFLKSRRELEGILGWVRTRFFVFNQPSYL